MSNKLLYFFLFLVSLHLIKTDDNSVDDLNIDPKFWKKRDSVNFPSFKSKFFHSFEVENFNQFEIQSTAAFNEEIENFKGNVFITFNTLLFINSKKKFKGEIQLCDTILNNLGDKYSLTTSCKVDKEFNLNLISYSDNDKIDLINLADFEIILADSNKDDKIKKKIVLHLFDKNFFKISVDSNELNEEDLKKYTLSKNTPFFNDEVQNYYYTTQVFDLNLFNIDYKDIEPSSDYCISFDYLSFKNEMIIQLSNSNTIKNENLFNLIDTNVNDEGNWYKIENFCLFKHITKPESYTNELNIKLIVKEVKSKEEHLFAISNFKKELKPRKQVNSFLASWESNGQLAIDQYFYFPQSNKFINLKDEKLKVEINFENDLPEYNILSELIEFDRNQDLNVNFKSNLNKFHLSLTVFNHLDEKVHEDIQKIIGSAELIEYKYSFNKIQEQALSNLKLFKVLIKVFDIEKSKEKINTIEFSQLYYADPCLQENICSKHGKCFPKSSSEFLCECDDTHVGENCQFDNRCEVPDDKSIIGKLFCKDLETDCLPIDNTFECICKDNYFWDKAVQNCVLINKCSEKICNLNQTCIEKENKVFCQNRENYYDDEDQVKFDLCSKSNNPCEENENCLSYLGHEKAICSCKDNYFKGEKNCEIVSLDNPFIKQKLGCDQLYKFKDDQIVCDCFEGYLLEEDKKSCKIGVIDLDNEKCQKCNSRQICTIAKKETGFDYECSCKNGFKGENCETSFCDLKNDELKDFCSNKGCNYFKSKEKFECLCKGLTNEVNEYGLCQVKEYCNFEEENNCKSLNSVCIPYFSTNSDGKKEILSKCQCKKGYEENSEGICVSKCSLKCTNPLKDVCIFDSEKNDVTCQCKNGFYEDETTKKCKLSKDSIKLDLKVFLNKQNDEYESFLFPKNDFIEICNEIPNDLKCLSKINLIYKELNKNFDDKFVTHFVESGLHKILYKSLENIFYQNNIKLDIISIKNLKEIDLQTLGVNAIYNVEVVLSSNNENDETILAKQFSIERLTDKCKKISDENKEEKIIAGINQNDYKDMCLLSPNLLMLKLETSVVNEQDLCEINNIISCGSYADCLKTTKNKINSYECKCKKGFQSNFVFYTDYDLKLNVCEDINECESEGNNDCEKESTTCENLIGDYKCNCKENFKVMNQTHCEAACKDSSKCLYGTCIIVEKNYERCSCQDGYQGENCSIEDKKVRLLKNMLISIIVCLSLIMTIIILSAYLYLKRNKSRESVTDNSALNDVFRNSNHNYERF